MFFNDAELFIENACIDFERETSRIDACVNWMNAVYEESVNAGELIEEAAENRSAGIWGAIVKIKDALIKFLNRIRSFIDEKIFHKDVMKQIQDASNDPNRRNDKASMIDTDAMVRADQKALNGIRGLIAKAKRGVKQDYEKAANAIKSDLQSEHSKIKTGVKIVTVASLAAMVLNYAKLLKSNNADDIKYAEASKAEYEKKAKLKGNYIVSHKTPTSSGAKLHGGSKLHEDAKRQRELTEAQKGLEKIQEGQQKFFDKKLSSVQNQIDEADVKLFKGQITENEYDNIVKSLEAHYNTIENIIYGDGTRAQTHNMKSVLGKVASAVSKKISGKSGKTRNPRKGDVETEESTTSFGIRDLEDRAFMETYDDDLDWLDEDLW